MSIDKLDGKTIAIIAHLSIIGWAIAMFLNRNNTTEIGSYYIGQMLGIFIVSALGTIPIFGLVFLLLAVLFWITSFVGAVSGKIYILPIIGNYFQDWFRSK